MAPLPAPPEAALVKAASPKVRLTGPASANAITWLAGGAGVGVGVGEGAGPGLAPPPPPPPHPTSSSRETGARMALTRFADFMKLPVNAAATISVVCATGRRVDSEIPRCKAPPGLEPGPRTAGIIPFEGLCAYSPRPSPVAPPNPCQNPIPP